MKTFQKALFTITICTVLFSCSSGSNDDEPDFNNDDYFISFKVDGTLVEYTQEPNEFKIVGNFNLDNDSNPNNTPMYTSIIFGNKDGAISNRNAFSVGITTQDENSTNVTYTNYATSPPNIEPVLFLMTYFDNNGIFYSVVNNINTIPTGGALNAELKYTSVNNNSIRGLFSGTLYNSDNDSSVTITEGEFYVERTQN